MIWMKQCILNVLSSFCNHLVENERVGCFILFVFLMSRGCQCSVSLPRGAVGWPAEEVIVAFPGHTHLLFAWVPIWLCTVCILERLSNRGYACIK